MSKLFKSKFIFGLVVALALVVATTASAYTFTAPTLKMGSRGQAVMELQKVLNANGYTVSATGAGSPGNETTSFGSRTRAAVMKWQAAMGLVADGVVGPASRAVLNGTTTTPSGNTSTVPGCTSTVGFSSTTGQKCDGTTTGGTTQTGPVTAMLASTNPAASTLVAGQATADLAHFAFNGTGTVTGVTLQRIGVSENSTLSNVYLFDGAMRLTDAASVTNNGMITFNNAAGLFMGGKTIAVKSDIAGSTSGQTVGVKLVSFVVNGSTVNADISGNIHTIATATLAQVSAGPVTPSNSTLNPGPSQTLWQSTLNVTQRDVMLRRLAVRQVGSAPANALTNFKLFVNGTQVGSTVASVDSLGYVTFDLRSNPVTLAAGSRLVRIDADVVSGASRTVQLSLRQASDVDFVDSSFGVNITPTLTPWVAGTANTIAGSGGGSLLISRDTSLASASVTDNSTDVEIGRFTAQAFGEPMKIETLKAAFGSSDSNVNSLRNGRVLIDGVQYGSTATLVTCDTDNDADCDGSDTSGTGTSFTLNYVVNPGTPVVISVRSDMFDNDGTNNLSNGDTVFAAIAVGSSNVVRQDSLGYTSVPTAIVLGQTMTNTTASASLLSNSAYANQTVNIPQTAYKLGSWTISAGSSEDLTLNTFSVDFGAVSGTTFTAADLSNVYFKYGASGVMTTPLSSVAATSNTYSANLTIPKGTSTTIELFGNILSGAITATDSIRGTLTVTGTSVTSGTTVTTSAVNGQTIVYNTGSLTISVDGSSPLNRIVAGNQEVTAGVFKFQASNDSFTVTRVNVSVGSATIASAVSAVKLYDGATLVGTLGFTGDDADSGTGNMASFTGLSWVIPSNTSKFLTVKLMLNQIGTGFGSSQQNAAVQLDEVRYQDSTGALTTHTTDYTANQMYVYKTVPTVAQVPLTTATLVNGVARDLYRVTLSASSQGNLAVRQVKFPVTWSDGGGAGDTLLMNSWKVFQDGTEVTSVVTVQDQAGQDIETTGNFGESDTTVVVTWPGTSELVVPAGSSVTLTLRATPAGFNVTDASTATAPDSFSIYMAGDSSHNGSSTFINVGTSVTSVMKLFTSAAAGDAGASNANLIWSDNSSSTHNAAAGTSSSGDWANGYKVLNLDLDPQGWTN